MGRKLAYVSGFRPIDMDGLGLTSALGGVVGAEHVLDDAEVTVGYGTAWAASEGVVPAAVVLPGNAAEVGAVLRVCAERGCPVVAQGGNTSMVGGATPPADGSAVILSLRRMDRLRSIDADAYFRLIFGRLLRL